MSDQAAELAELVFNYFDGRRGFDEWFEGIDYRTQQELKEGLAQVLRRKLEDKVIGG